VRWTMSASCTLSLHDALPISSPCLCLLSFVPERSPKPSHVVKICRARKTPTPKVRLKIKLAATLAKPNTTRFCVQPIFISLSFKSHQSHQRTFHHKLDAAIYSKTHR